MRRLIAALGVSGIVVYAILGMLLMNSWAVTTASRLSIDVTISEMTAADQPYSAIPGIVFASVGVLLAVAWGWVALFHRATVPNDACLAIWGAIVALGAPAYFALSFSNMNAVGDTFVEWNADAAFALEAPLYIVSGLAALLAAIASVPAFRVPGRKRLSSGPQNTRTMKRQRARSMISRLPSCSE